MPKDRIIIAHLTQKEGDQKTSGWSKDAEIAYSDDLFKTRVSIVPRGNKFLITTEYFFTVQVYNENEQDVSLLISKPRSHDYNFKEVELPAATVKKNLLEHSYTILDTSEGQVFLHINHEGDRSKFGNIYISDSTGIRYSTSLRNQVRSADGQCDFEKVAGLEGIYMTNLYDPEVIKKLKSEFSGKSINVEKEGSKSKGGKVDSRRYREIDNYKQTKISFDKGAMWSYIAPPKYNSLGKKVECEEEDHCFLHLHSFSNTDFGPFYSSVNSLGIVIGTGNVGRYLSNKEDEVATYLSRDAGLTWYEVKNAPLISVFNKSILNRSRKALIFMKLEIVAPLLLSLLIELLLMLSIIHGMKV